ncbi:hypothetical protein ACLOJK_020892 [Asimina triloba]
MIGITNRHLQQLPCTVQMEMHNAFTGSANQVASATATFVMMFSSSLSVVEFYFLKRFPIPYALYLIAVSVLAGFWGQCLVRRIVTMLKRASVIVFILSAVIFASALTMGNAPTYRFFMLPLDASSSKASSWGKKGRRLLSQKEWRKKKEDSNDGMEGWVNN